MINRLLKLSLVSIFIFTGSLWASPPKITKIKGRVEAYRGKLLLKLSEKTELKAGDIIRTAPKSFIKFEVNDSVITIAPASYYEIKTKKDKNGDVEVGKLLYGHLKAVFLKSEYKKRKISSSSAALGIRGTKILLHVARNASEYTSRYNGASPTKTPSLKDLQAILKNKDLFTQVCCIEGTIEVKTKGKLNRELTQGNVINFFSSGKKLQAYNYEPKTIQKTIKKLKLDF